VTLTAGSASITLRRDGTVIIKGKDIVFDAAGDASIRAAGDVILKGRKVVEN
jgi:type VI secretion system secreted protein VgrG